MSIATDQARLADERFADAQRQSVFSIRSADNASLNAARSLERLQEQYRTAPTDDLRVRLNEAADASAQADERAKEARRRRDEADEEHDVQSALRNQRLEEQRQQAEDAAAAKRNQVQEQADAMLNRAAGMGADKTTQLAAFADMWKELGSQEEKAAIGQAAFGRGWVEMAPLLQQGGQALIAAMAVAKQYTIPLLEPEKKMAAAFVEGFARMKSIIEANVRVIGDTLGQMFVPAMNRIADFFKNNHDAITAWATAAVRNVVDFGHAIGEFLLPPLQLVSEVVQTVGSFLSGIASGLNSIFGGNLSGGSILGFVVGLRLLAVTLRVAATAAAALRVALLAFDFGGVMAVIGALGAGFGALAGWIRGATVAMFAFDAAGALPLGALALIVAALASLGIGIYLAITHWDQLKANLQAFAGWLLGGFLKAWDYIASYISGVFKDAVKWVEDFINKVEAAIKKVGSLLSASSGAPGGDLGGAATPFARGGHVGGHGHGDTVPAMLTPGEFVVRQPAVAHYGAQVFHAINNMRANIQGFSLGGMVGGFNDWSASLAPGPVLSFAAGGIVPAISGGGGGRTINIHINGETIGPLHTSDDRVVEAAERASSRSQIRSAGRMPSWFTPVG
ncbi:MAG TPA: hypothetical protein VNF04_04095 [Stellaceae bacterium]|nr:hypothetical protein [Stellaceae bacterium]